MAARRRRRNQRALDKRELWKEIRRGERQKARERMRELKAATRGTRAVRQETRAATKAACGSAREEARAKARAVCDAGSERYAEARDAHRRAAGELAAEKQTRRELRAIERSARSREAERRRAAPTAAVRRSESDDEMRANLDPELLPLWEKIKRAPFLRATPRRTHLEAFLEYAEAHPGEVIEAQGDPYERAALEMQSRSAQANPSKDDRAVSSWLAEHEKRKAALAAWLDANDGRAFSIWLRSIGDTGLVSLDPSKPGRWRLTRFEGDEPVGHSEHATWREAARYAVEDYRGDIARVRFHNPRKRPMANKHVHRPERRAGWTKKGLRERAKRGTKRQNAGTVVRKEERAKRRLRAAKRNPGVHDERSDESRRATYGYVVARDTFLSGWGEAEGGASYYALAVRGGGDARIVIDNFRARPDFKNIRFVRRLPKIGPSDHLTVADWVIAPRYYVEGAFRKGNPKRKRAGAYVAEEMRARKRGKGRRRSKKQAVAIGLARARRAGVKVPKKRNDARFRVQGSRSPRIGWYRTFAEANRAAMDRTAGSPPAWAVVEDTLSGVVVAGYHTDRKTGKPRPDVWARNNPAMTPTEAIKRYRRDHWGQSGKGQVRGARAPNPRAGVLVELGELVEVVYRTRKGLDRKLVDYEHTFKARRPTLAYNETGLIIVDGDYTVTVRGIVG